MPVGSVTIPLAEILQLGAVNQFAEAAPKARSRAAAGAVSSTGAINTAGSGEYPADATISLTPWLEAANPSGTFDDAEIHLRAISAVAALEGAEPATVASSCGVLSAPVHCRDYTIAGGDIILSVPALADLVTALTGDGGVASQVDAETDKIASDLIQTVDTVLSSQLDPTLAALVTADSIDASVETDIAEAMNSIVTTPLVGDGVTVHLDAGTITADLEALFGGPLTDLPPSTEILSAAVLETLASQVDDLLVTTSEQVETAVRTALKSAAVSISGGACLTGSTGPKCVQETVVDVALGEVIVDTGSGFSLDVQGSLGEMDQATLDLDVKLRGVPLPADDLTTLSTELLDALTAETDSVVADTLPLVLADLTTVTPDLRTSFGLAVSGLSQVVSLLVNVQEAGRTPEMYREVALRVTLGTATGNTGFAQLDLAAVEVGGNHLAAAPPQSPIVPEPEQPGPSNPVPSEPQPSEPGESERPVVPEEPEPVLPEQPGNPGAPEPTDREPTDPEPIRPGDPRSPDVPDQPGPPERPAGPQPPTPNTGTPTLPSVGAPSMLPITLAGLLMVLTGFSLTRPRRRAVEPQPRHRRPRRWMIQAEAATALVRFHACR